MVKFTITNNDAHQTLFKFLKKSFSTTPLSVIYKWFRKGKIKLNGRTIKDQKYFLQVDDEIQVFDGNQPKPRSEFKYVKDATLEIIFEDENILIVNKSPNLEIHSPINISLDDLVKSYLVDSQQYQPEKESSFVVSHVHRLDKLTSGLVIYAKNKLTLDLLLAAFKNQDSIEKYYWLLVLKKNWNDDFTARGWIKYDSEKQLSLFREQEKKGFKNCETKFCLLKMGDQFASVEAQLLTGRKHQIRATLAYYKMPIVNDFRYGGLKLNHEKMIFLTAYKLVFNNLPAPLDYLQGMSFELQIENE